MDLKGSLLNLDLTDRLSYDPDRNVLFLNFEGLHVRQIEDVASIQDAVVERCQAIGRRVAVVVNYDAFRLDQEVETAYAEMVRGWRRRTTRAYLGTRPARSCG